MTNHLAFARKYRPQVFSEIIGQPHIVTTLTNAIAQGRVAHAYLFAGPRGVGKTTTARILAKALNCQNAPTPSPCNKCPVCNDISRGTSFDILEIDGASNRGIDEIRSLRENVKFAPSKGKFKIYIIDEVHMLTSEAFNALLKTLEEPPEHVIFIFATTQAYKVPPTVISRCQRFDFRRIPLKEIFSSLKAIAAGEKIRIDDDALSMIAKYSDGAMRDAQVMLDQLASFAKDGITPADVAGMLGVVDDDALFGLSAAIKDKDPKAALVIVDRLVNDGKDVFQAVTGLIEHFRNMIMTKISSDAASLVEASPEKVARYAKEAESFSVEDILYVVYTLSNTIDFMRKSGIARIPFEVGLVKLSRAGGHASLDKIVERIEGLEKKLGSEIRTQAPEPREQKEEPPQKKTESNTVITPPSADLDEALASWGNISKSAMAKKTFVGYYLQEGYPVSLEGDTITIGFPQESKFHKETLETKENKAVVAEAIKSVLHQELKVVFTLVEPTGPGKTRQEDYSAEASAAQDADYGSDGALGNEADPIVKAAMEMFGGQVARSPAMKGKVK